MKRYAITIITIIFLFAAFTIDFAELVPFIQVQGDY